MSDSAALIKAEMRRRWCDGYDAAISELDLRKWCVQMAFSSGNTWSPEEVLNWVTAKRAEKPA